MIGDFRFQYYITNLGKQKMKIIWNIFKMLCYSN